VRSAYRSVERSGSFEVPVPLGAAKVGDLKGIIFGIACGEAMLSPRRGLSFRRMVVQAAPCRAATRAKRSPGARLMPHLTCRHFIRYKIRFDAFLQPIFRESMRWARRKNVSPTMDSCPHRTAEVAWQRPSATINKRAAGRTKSSMNIAPPRRTMRAWRSGAFRVVVSRSTSGKISAVGVLTSDQSSGLPHHKL